jgi:Sleepless protein
MIQKFILCVAVITIISNSANGESENRGVAHARIQVFSLSIDFIACYCNRGQPVQCENNSISVSWSFHIELKTISLLVLGLIKRCYQCRSRGELGSCKDPFRYNASHVDAEPGRFYKLLDFDMATQRMCVQRGPDDSEDRCANTVYNHKKVFMCFCQGDLCNDSQVIHGSMTKIIIISSVALLATRQFLMKVR